MSAAQGEDAIFHLYRACLPNDRQFDGRCHMGGKFVRIAGVDAAHGIFTGIAKGLGDLGGGQPGLAVVGDNGELGVMEADAVHDGIL